MLSHKTDLRNQVIELRRSYRSYNIASFFALLFGVLSMGAIFIFPLTFGKIFFCGLIVSVGTYGVAVFKMYYINKAISRLFGETYD